MSKPKIKAIEIELNDYERIRFTMDEAKELYEQLLDLFGSQEQHNHYHDYTPWWRQPYYTWTNTAGNSYTKETSTASGLSNAMLASNNVATVLSNETGMAVSYIGES